MDDPMMIFFALTLAFAVFLWWLGRPLRQANAALRRANSGAEVHAKADGLLLVQPDGSARFMGFWESLRYRLFGTMPKEQPNG